MLCSSAPASFHLAWLNLYHCAACPLPLAPSSQPMATTVLMTVSVSVITLDFSYNEYWSFCDWPVSLSNVFTVHLCYHIGQYLLLFFLRLHIFSLSTHPSIRLVVPVSWLEWLMLQSTCVCKCLFKILFSVLLDMYTEVELPDPVVLLFLIFWGPSMLFTIAVIPFYSHSRPAQGFWFLRILTNACYFFSVVSVLTNMKSIYYLTVVFIFSDN